ncbi:putative DD41D transposase [Trichonephila clavipes]|uniref:Putative DD41D transposase n=1 Tax=Trichonephila clavipes TaxID=2585209 RepID=A0A8X6S839_TRICX|nr:putative DD41D transposase [Trichonephila clavipes]
MPSYFRSSSFIRAFALLVECYVNKQNCRIWSEANPQVYVETSLHPEKLTVWCALWAGGIIGPYFFKNDEGHNVTVNGDRYRAMITNFFIPELNNRDVQELWFQQDGATCHTARATIDLLRDTFVNALVYADKPQTLDHLEDNIRRVIADIRPQMLEKVIENWTSRLDYIRASCGSPMPEIIFKMLKRSLTLQLDCEIRKELNLEHSSLEFLQEPLIPKTLPKNTCFKLELLQPCSKKEDPVTLRQKGLETIEILSQDNFAITYTDGSSDRSLSNGGAGILLPDGNNYKHKINTGIITSNFTSELMAIREALILYQRDPHVIDSTEGLVIFSDSKSAIEAIRNGETNISCDIITLLEQLHSKRKSCILQWIPAHVNIEGNECADIYIERERESLAKDARDMDHKCTTITLDDANAVAKH